MIHCFRTSTVRVLVGYNQEESVYRNYTDFRATLVDIPSHSASHARFGRYSEPLSRNRSGFNSDLPFQHSIGRESGSEYRAKRAWLAEWLGISSKVARKSV